MELFAYVQSLLLRIEEYLQTLNPDSYEAEQTREAIAALNQLLKLILLLNRAKSEGRDRSETVILEEVCSYLWMIALDALNRSGFFDNPP